ncbi:hypothetical protein TCAL_04011 [Tigriopus californicus]|uniref:Uncharacterized protein n=1 Tax=Tigriopus californicus TaxID=6832 RepID=A0A553NCL1_TIGCA|nr:alpha- and gamma-adaptin-binding protein p34-like [Tigriopus californicus]TRY63180.1 hypothetical protein TCAL_04011 [Tigriopus californicus]|eukprot:TCALIF_04011-PA protein Name:"Similar to Aagab Alpha- and gamma-adaptin-binding protein p34 (Rattus norvegicus)" AED:0.01 eAED:0.01 QI:31/1/0.5/1/1/0.5/2/0/252
MASLAKEDVVPGVCLIMNQSEEDSDFVRELLFQDELLKPNADGCLWENRNKYYSCQVEVLIAKDWSEIKPNKLKEVCATLIYLGELNDASQMSSLEKILAQDLDNSDTKLVVAQNLKQEALKSELNQLVIEHGMEIIDLSEEFKEDDDDNDGTSGIFAKTPQKRIIEALQTCPWPNMNSRNGTPKRLENAPNAGQEPEMEDFEKLFAQFATFKEQSTNMSESERKKHAENVVLSFWNALGGDPEELAGLDSD